MQLSRGCGGDFTTNASVVDQISKRQDVCQVSSKNPTTPLAFIQRSLLRDDALLLLLNNCFSTIKLKIASKGEGRKPS